jgi:hypothetical protein
VRQAVGSQVQVPQRGREVAVAEQALQSRQVGPGFEQVRRVAVPQRVARRRLPQAGGPAGLLNRPLQVADIQRLAGRPGEEPVRRAVLLPVDPQFVEQFVRQWYAAILVPLPMTDPEHVPLTVDVGDPQVGQLADPQPTAVGDPQHQPIAPGGDRVEEPADIVGAEDHGQCAGLLAVGDEGDEVGPVEDVAVEEPQGRGDLVEQAPGGTVGDEVELEGAELVGGELVGRGVEMPGNACNGGDVGFDGPGGAVAAGQLLDESLAERGHA